MALVEQGVDGVCAEERNGKVVHIFESNLVVLLRLLLRIAQLMLVFEDDRVRQISPWKCRGVSRCRADAYIHSLCNLPGFEHDTHALSEENHPRGTLSIVDKVKQDDCLHEDVGKDSADRDANIVFLVPPVRLQHRHQHLLSSEVGITLQYHF